MRSLCKICSHVRTTGMCTFRLTQRQTICSSVADAAAFHNVVSHPGSLVHAWANALVFLLHAPVQPHLLLMPHCHSEPGSENGELRLKWKTDPEEYPKRKVIEAALAAKLIMIKIAFGISSIYQQKCRKHLTSYLVFIHLFLLLNLFRQKLERMGFLNNCI